MSGQVVDIETGELVDLPWPTHPAADLFPLLAGQELQELADDIAANGLTEAVWLYDDPERGRVILDGRNRARACQMAGVEIAARVYTGDDPVTFVRSENLRRRHLTQSQTAFIAAGIAEIRAAEAAAAISRKRSEAAAERDRERAEAERVLTEREARLAKADELGLDAEQKADVASATSDAEKAAQHTAEMLNKRVYFIRTDERVKIGVSWSPQQRLAEIRKHNPDAELIADLEGAFDVERAFHRRLEDHALGNEWFAWCDDVQWAISEAYQMCTGAHLAPAQAAHPDEIDTVGAAAKEAGVSRRYVALAKKVEREAPDLADKVRAGEIDLRRAERVIRDREAEARRVEQARREAEAAPEPLTVDPRRGDFRSELADLTDVDAVITDPPYGADSLELLNGLAVWADKVLADDGVLAVLLGQSHLPEAYERLSGRRPYRWTACYLTTGPGYVSHGAKVQSQWKPVLVYGGGPRFSDVFKSSGDDKRHHRWGQNYDAFYALVERLTEPRQTVADPFMGGGTTLLAAHALGRHAVGCDTDDDSYRKACERLGVEA